MPETLPHHRGPAAPTSAARASSAARRAPLGWSARALAGVGALALLLTACGSDSAAAVTVGTQSVDEATVNRDLAAIATNPELKERAVEKGKLNPAAAAAWVSVLVQAQVAEQAIERAGTGITKADRTAAEHWADGFFGSPAAFAAFPKEFRDEALARYANVPAYVRTHTKPPTEALVRAAYDTSLVQNCASKRYVSHILVAREAAAKSIEAELTSGADFKKVARRRSTDQQSGARGGALGCIDGQQIDPTFAATAEATPVGQVSAPVQTQFGWHVIKVEDVATALPFADVKEEIRADLIEQGPEGTAKLQKLAARAKVKIASRYGRWVVKDGKGSVQPISASAPGGGPSSSSSTSPTTKP